MTSTALAPGSSVPVELYLQSAAARQGQGRLSSTTLVLAFIASTGVGTHAPFTPAEVRAWIRERLGLDVDRRRIHEALTELVRKGILERLARGLYRVKSAAKALAEFARRLTGSRLYRVRCTRGTTDLGARVAPVSAGGSCYVVARWHRRVRRGSPLDWLVELFMALGVVEGFARCARRRVRELLRRVGFSGYRLRRLASRARGLVERLCRCEFRVGAHGAGDGRFYPWEELVRLALGLERPWQHWREFGVDVVCCSGGSGGVAGDGGSGGGASVAGGLEDFVEELREVMGFQMVYVPLNGAGSRR